VGGVQTDQPQKNIRSNSDGLQNNNRSISQTERLPQQVSPSQRAGGNSQPSGSSSSRNSRLNERLKQYRDEIIQGTRSPQSASPQSRSESESRGNVGDRKPSLKMDQNSRSSSDGDRQPHSVSPKQSAKSIIRGSEQKERGSKLELNNLFKNNNSRSSGSEFRAPSPSRSSGGGSREMRSPSSGPRR
jgi:hypothetical protein